MGNCVVWVCIPVLYISLYIVLYFMCCTFFIFSVLRCVQTLGGIAGGKEIQTKYPGHPELGKSSSTKQDTSDVGACKYL